MTLRGPCGRWTEICQASDGIENPRDRQTLLELARDFKRIADQALEFENEQTEDNLIGPLETAAK